MTKPVRVDAEVYAELQRRAVPVESPNNTIRRILGLPPQGRKQGTPMPGSSPEGAQP